jgi:hypothetical protein
VLTVHVQAGSVKHIHGDDPTGQWRREGYAGACTSGTSMSRNPECVWDPSRATVTVDRACCSRCANGHSH